MPRKSIPSKPAPTDQASVNRDQAEAGAAAPESSEAAEQLALVLSRHGLQRMTARLLAAFLFTEQPTLTMGDLVDVLGVSAGSASTGIRTLVDVGLVEQVPAPSSRRDHYRMREDAWATLFSTQNAAVRVMQEAAAVGIASSAPDSRARRRLQDMRDFYDFILAEIPALIDRWHEQSGHHQSGHHQYGREPA